MKEFLENSTIHGLSYISTTKRFSKLFWIVIVLSGFFGASILINSSFQEWKESPIKTIIETFSIEKIEFPVVTVCPTKNTFTILNYDLLMANQTTSMNKENTKLLTKTTVEKMQELEFISATSNLLQYEYKERFRGWYFGNENCFNQFPSRNFEDHLYSPKEEHKI